MKLCLFDIDGTLLISSGLGREAKARAMREVFGTDAGVKTHPFGGKTDWQILGELLAPLGYNREQIGQRMDEYQETFAHYMQALAPEFPPKPLIGAHELVADLRARPDILLGLVTGNTRRTAPVKLAAAGFDPVWFVVGAYGNESDNRNDLPALAIQRAHAHTGQVFAPDAVYVIGDTIADIDCARAVGAVAVVVLTGFEDKDALRTHQPDYLLNDLREFLSVVPL